MSFLLLQTTKMWLVKKRRRCLHKLLKMSIKKRKTIFGEE